MPKRSTRHQRDLEDALRRIYALSHREQMQAFETLHAHLELGVGIETLISRELRERREALAAMKRAAAHLALPAGVAPDGPQYDIAAAAVGLMDRSKVIRIYQRWKNAQNALTGGWVPLTPAQRSLRRATSGRAREHETYLNGIRIWLKDLKLATEYTNDYDSFAEVYNDELGPGEAPLVQASTIRVAFPGLLWEEIVAGARRTRPV